MARSGQSARAKGLLASLLSRSHADSWGAELVLAALGIIVVLVAGAIWRKRTLQNAEQAAKAA